MSGSVSVIAAGSILGNLGASDAAPSSVPGLFDLHAAYYGVKGDNSTDNNTAIAAWIAAANALITAGTKVNMILSPGLYKTSGRHVFPGDADVTFTRAQLIAIGTDDTAPTFTHGNATTTSYGSCFGIDVTSTVSHKYYNPNCVAVRFLNKSGAHHHVKGVAGHRVGIQMAASGGAGFCAYNTVIVGKTYQCPISVECINKDTTSFCSENTFIGMNSAPQITTVGSTFGIVFSRDWDTAHSDHSGNNFYNTCFQQQQIGATWAASTTLAQHTRYYSPQIGGEWLCKTGGTSGSTEPSVVPTPINVTGISLTAGSNIMTMSSTSGLSAGMHIRGTNPTDAFPMNAYIGSITDSTHLTVVDEGGNALNASQASSTYKAYFTPVTTDGGATLVFLGPYRRSAVWHRDCAVSNSVLDCRFEASVGEFALFSGPHLWPEQASSAGGCFNGTYRSYLSGNRVNIGHRYPTWQASHAYSGGDMSRPTVANGTYWDTFTAGTSGSSEPSSPPTAVGSLITDGTQVWIVRAMPKTSLVGDYTGGQAGGSAFKWKNRVRQSVESGESTASIDNLHLRAIGSSTGWAVQGMVKVSQFGSTPTQIIPAADLVLARDALLLPSTTDYVGCFVRTTIAKAFQLRIQTSEYSGGRGCLVAYDKSYNQLGMSSNQVAYHRRIQANYGFNSGQGLPVSQSDGDQSPSFMVNDEVAYCFIGFRKGSSSNSSIAGFSLVEMPIGASNVGATNAVQLFTNEGNDRGFRGSFGTPTAGYFKAKGEFIQNLSVVTGNTTPKGWFVTTAGILAPAWVTTTAYVRGQLVTNGGNVYAANGAFTSGTGPSGTTANISDGTATGVTSGDVASWDYMGPAAVLTADENLT